MAESEKQSGKETEALKAFSRAGAVDPGHARAHLQRAKLLAGRTSYEAALAAADLAVKANPYYTDALVERGDARLRAGVVGLGTGKPAPKEAQEAARADYDAALALDPDRVEAVLGRALTLAALGKRERALADVERTIDLASRPPGTADSRRWLATAYEIRGAAHAAEGRLAPALADARRAEELKHANRKAAEDHFNEGTMLMRAGGREREAIEKFTESIEADRTFALAWYGRADARFKMLETLDSALDVSRALELDASYADDVFQNASEQADALDLAPLYQQVAEVLKTSPDDVPALFLQGLYAVTRTFLGKAAPPEIELGLASLDRVVLLSSRHAFAYVCRGYLRQHRGDLDGALADVGRAKQLQDRSALTPYLTAMIYAKKGERAAALDALEEARARGLRGIERLKQEPAFAPLRSEERWAALIKGLSGE